VRQKKVKGGSIWDLKGNRGTDSRGKSSGTLGQQVRGNALWADGIFHRVSDDDGTMELMGRRMSIGVS
jgi:hypothetical protein